jgi:hypothetical protein
VMIVLIFWFVCSLKTFCVQRRRRREGLLIPDKATHVGAVSREPRCRVAWLPRRLLEPLGAFLTPRCVCHRHPTSIQLDHGFSG